MLENEKKKPISGRKLTVVNNQIKLDPKNPIPIQYNGNSFSIVRGKEYIPFLGPKDNFPNLLLEARLTSTTQNACIGSIAASVIGNGIVVLEQESPDADMIKWMKSVNNDLESFDDVMFAMVDGELGNGTHFIEVVKGKVGAIPFMKLYEHPLQYCRFGPEDEKTGKPTNVIISKLFTKRGYVNKISDARKIPLWSPNILDKETCWVDDGDGTLRTMLCFKNKVGGIDHYGMPASVAGLRYQVLEGKSAQYNLDNFDNNMILGGILMFKSSMTEGEAQKNAEKIILSHTGDGNTGRIAVISSEGGLEDVKFEKFETSKDGSFIELDKRIEEKIIAANNWDAIFMGISKGTHLGTGSSYIRSVFDVKEATLLNPLRRKLIDKIVVPIMQIYAEVFDKEEILNYNFWFNSATPFSFLGDITPDQFMQVNEARELAGLKTDDTKNNIYLSEMKPKSNVQNKSTA